MRLDEGVGSAGPSAGPGESPIARPITLLGVLPTTGPSEETGMATRKQREMAMRLDENVREGMWSQWAPTCDRLWNRLWNPKWDRLWDPLSLGMWSQVWRLTLDERWEPGRD